MLSAMPRRAPFQVLVILAVVTLAGCERRGGCTGAYCGTLINAAVAEPPTLLPPSSENVVVGDIGEQLFLKLADVGMSTNTVGDEDFQPLLAQRWEWDGPLTLVFHIDPRARWQDGPRVTATDVAFTFDAYNDSAVASPYRPQLKRIASVTPRDSLTAGFRPREPGPAPRGAADRVVSLSRQRVRFSELQPPCQRRHGDAQPHLRRSRSAPRARHGDRSRQPRPQHARRARQSAAGTDVIAPLDLGSGDPPAPLRYRAGSQ